MQPYSFLMKCDLRSLQLSRKFIIAAFTLVLFFATDIYAQKKTSVLKLCAKMNGEPFVLFTDDSSKGAATGFKKYKDTNLFMRDFKIMVDGVHSAYFKPVERTENCITIFRIEPGKRSVSLDFKSVLYTNIQTKEPVTVNFKPDLLHNGNIEIAEGPTATVIINQSGDSVTAYQAMDNQEIKGCSEKCQVPVGIPVYFMIKSQDEKIKCPTKFELIVDSEDEKKLSCYDEKIIQKALADFVEKNNVLCRVNVEYAFFKVYGEGCLFSLEADKEGLRYQTPELKLLPLDKQKFKYFWKINSEEKKPYPFSGDRKGAERTPAEGDVIEIIEERNF
jgi:hypothetical protein